MLRSIGKHSGGIRGVSREEEKEGHGGKDLQKRKVLSLERKSEGSVLCVFVSFLCVLSCVFYRYFIVIVRIKLLLLMIMMIIIIIIF